MCRTRIKIVRAISTTVYSIYEILVLIIEENLPIGDIVNDRIKKKSVEYTTSQIIGQTTIEHPKQSNPKKVSAINTRSIRKEITTNADLANICLISKGKTQMIVLLSTLKNFILQLKRLKNSKYLKQTIFAKHTVELWNSKSIRKQKSYWQMILSLT